MLLGADTHSQEKDTARHFYYRGAVSLPNNVIWFAAFNTITFVIIKIHMITPRKFMMLDFGSCG